MSGEGKRGLPKAKAAEPVLYQAQASSSIHLERRMAAVLFTVTFINGVVTVARDFSYELRQFRSMAL